MAVRHGRLLVLLLGDVIVVAEAHRDIVFIFPNIIGILRVIIRPARHFWIAVGIFVTAEAFGIAGEVEKPAAGGQAAQAVGAGIGAGADVARDADGRIELHDGSRHDAVERLDGRDLPVHGLVVHSLVEIRSAVFEIRQIDLAASVHGVWQELIAHVLGLRFAQCDEERRIDDGNHRHANRRIPQEFFRIPFIVPQHDAQQKQAHQRDGDVCPEPRGVILQPDGGDFHTVDRLGGGHQADRHGHTDGDSSRPAEGARPVDPGVLHGEDRREGHHQREHIEPACVIGRIEQLERRVEDRHPGHQKEDAEHFLEPVTAAALQKADDARHAEQRQPCPERRPFRSGIRREVGPGREIRREEQALQDVEIPLAPAVDQRVPAVGRVVDARILHHSEDRRQQEDACQQQTEHRFQQENRQIAQAEPPAPA